MDWGEGVGNGRWRTCGVLMLMKLRYWGFGPVAQCFANGHISLCVCGSDLTGVCIKRVGSERHSPE